MTGNNNSYTTKVRTEGNEFWQPAVTVGAANGNGSSYRVTGVHYGGIEEQQQIQRVIITTTTTTTTSTTTTSFKIVLSRVRNSGGSRTSQLGGGANARLLIPQGGLL